MADDRAAQAERRREQNRLAAKRSRERKRRASALPVETEHSRKIVSDLVAERDLTVGEHELVRQCGQVIAELEELDRILRFRTADWLTTALADIEEQMGPGIEVYINPDPMFAAVDRKRTLLKGLVAELRQWRAMADRAGAGTKAPAPAPVAAAPAVTAVPEPGGGDDDFDLFGAG